MSATTNTQTTHRGAAPPPRVMDAADARSIAYASHLQGRTRHGELLVEHVARVAAAVPAEARTLAWLHDVLEKSSLTLDDLRAQGLGGVDADALRVLTRSEGESYELHALRIAHAPGDSGRRARIVKLADLDDHLLHPWTCGDPPYSWARRHVSRAAATRDQSPLS